MSIVDRDSETFPHGTPAGYTAGCDSVGGCRYHDDPTYLSCKDAAAVWRTDYTLRQQPDTIRIRRDGAFEHTDVASLEPAEPIAAAVGFSDAEIRAWARSNGIDPGIRGPLKREARLAYEAALPTPAPRPDHATPTPAGTIADLTARLERTLAANVAEQEAHALTAKKLDDALAAGQPAIIEDLEARLKQTQTALDERILRHQAEVHDLTEHSKALEATLSDTLEQLEQARPAELVEVPPPVRIGGGNPPTRVIVGDVALEVPAGTLASLQVRSDAVHVQIGR